MTYKTDPDMQMVTAYLPRADADALVALANSRGLSRAELLRQVARELIEHDKEHTP